MPTRAILNALQSSVDRILLGKPHEVRLALCCLLAGGHLLIEDLPGVGKTTLARGLGAVLGLRCTRIQFTADLMPADIIGVSIFDPATRRFTFNKGPLFTELLLADEINRASPKTQSALLEAMAENQVTVDGEVHALPQPFFVIATQNPRTQAGTFPLPESQLDRFLMRLALGTISRDAERALLTGADRREIVRTQPPLVTPAQILSLRAQAAAVRVSGALLDYVQDVLERARALPTFAGGVSPRAGLGLLAAARAYALILGRDHVLPEDVQAVAVAVLAHRIESTEPERQVAQLLRNVAIP
ncbi:MAG: AAA family ATPase [Acidiferrobacteraceae bacterium]